MTQTVETNTLNDFDQARALILSYYMDADDANLPEILMKVRETCSPGAFHRVLILAAAIDDPRFDRYGLADVLPLLRDLEITSDLLADVERLLDAMRQEDEAVEAEARLEAAKYADPFYRVAVRLLRKFRNPTLEQAMFELSRL
jgi:hypothetical protein